MRSRHTASALIDKPVCGVNSRRAGRVFVGVQMLAAVFLLSLIATGCTQNYGRIQSNDTLTQLFQGGGALPDYTYFYCGRYNLPWAVIGIHPDLQLKTRVWKPVDNREKLDNLSKKITDYDRHFAWGFDIVGPSGDPLGIYYSTFTSTMVKMISEDVIEIYCPYRGENGPGSLQYTLF